MSKTKSTPQTSLIAHENADSFRADHCNRILKAIKDAPGSTSGEIAYAIGIEKVAVSRRLPEIEKDGAIYRDTARHCACPMCASKQLTWQPKQSDGMLFDVEPEKKGYFR